MSYRAASATAVEAPSHGKISRRLPHLDGLRGVAILLVLVGHTLDKAGATDSTAARVLAPIDSSTLGVEVFFALSGYLITRLLLAERLETGSIGLRRFYGRRVLRIWPAYYCLIAALVVASAVAHNVQITSGQTLSASLFVWNYSPASGGWWLGHSWSLAIEEQFYLVWPLILLLCSPRMALRVAVVGIALEPVVRVGSYVVGISDRARIPVYFHTRLDILLFGAAAALLPVVVPEVHRRVVEIIRRLHLTAVAVTVLAISAWLAIVLKGAYQLSVGWTVDGVCCATILLGIESDCVLRRVLSVRPLTLLGLISFSLYLWQQLFMGPWDNPILGSVVLAPILAVASAAVSYTLIERPFLRIKRRYEFRKSSTGPVAALPRFGTPDPAGPRPKGRLGIDVALSETR